MAEYGDYKKEIKTLGDLRTFVNETLKSIEDDYTFDIDDDFMGIDIILTANCDVSYSSKSFYWTANVNYVNDVKKVVEDRIKAKHKIKALEIIKKKCLTNCNIALVKDNLHYQNYCKEFEYFLNKYNESPNGFEITKEDLLTEEEFNLLKEVLE